MFTLRVLAGVGLEGAVKTSGAKGVHVFVEKPMALTSADATAMVEAAGLPEEGISAGTRWEDVPVNWVCPECGARKEDFELVEI